MEAEGARGHAGGRRRSGPPLTTWGGRPPPTGHPTVTLPAAAVAAPTLLPTEQDAGNATLV